MDNAALNDNVHTHTLINSNGMLDILQLLASFETRIIDILQQRVNIHNGIKWWISVFLSYSRENSDGEIEYVNVVFTSETNRLFQGDDISLDLASVFNNIFIQSDEFVAQGSAWILHEIHRIEVHNVRHVPLQVGTYTPCPNGICKRSVINVKNVNDNKCILWSILCQLYPANKNPAKVSHYLSYESRIKHDGVRFPTPISDIDKLENLNNFSIHVFVYDKQTGITPFRIAKHVKKVHVNLLLLTKVCNDKPSASLHLNQANTVNHYCLIKDFHLLMKGKKDLHALYRVRYCYNCLQHFSSKKILDEHCKYCVEAKCQRTIFPETENQKWIKFRSVHKQLQVPFVIYADFECFTEKIQHDQEQTTNTYNYQRHVPSSFCYLVVCANDEYNKGPVLYSEKSKAVVDSFFDCLMEEECRIKTILATQKPMNLTEEQEKAFFRETFCHICEESYVDFSNKVRDHDHLTGQYRGSAHKSCNLKFRWGKNNPLNKFGFRIPVILHNLRGYNSHLLMRAFGKYKNRRMSCIATNSEKFVTFSTGALSFVDSFQFLPSSLGKLVDNLANDNQDNFKLLSKVFTKDSEKSLLLRKGVFPYDYFDNILKLDEPNLPTQSCFFSELNQESCSDEDYKHAQTVWSVFKCKTFKDYHDIYLQTDVLQLADVFENFRKMSLKTYRLDPAHYFTSPGLAWDAMLR